MKQTQQIPSIELHIESIPIRARARKVNRGWKAGLRDRDGSVVLVFEPTMIDRTVNLWRKLTRPLRQRYYWIADKWQDVKAKYNKK